MHSWPRRWVGVGGRLRASASMSPGEPPCAIVWWEALGPVCTRWLVKFPIIGPAGNRAFVVYPCLGLCSD